MDDSPGCNASSTQQLNDSARRELKIESKDDQNNSPSVTSPADVACSSNRNKTKETIAQLQADFDAFEAEKAGLIEAHRQKVSAKDEKIQSLQSEITNVEEDINSLIAFLGEARDQRADALASVRDLQEQLFDAQQALAHEHAQSKEHVTAMVKQALHNMTNGRSEAEAQSGASKAEKAQHLALQKRHQALLRRHKVLKRRSAKAFRVETAAKALSQISNVAELGDALVHLAETSQEPEPESEEEFVDEQ